jgi:hypothetical protein
VCSPSSREGKRSYPRPNSAPSPRPRQASWPGPLAPQPSPSPALAWHPHMHPPAGKRARCVNTASPLFVGMLAAWSHPFTVQAEGAGRGQHRLRLGLASGSPHRRPTQPKPSPVSTTFFVLLLCLSAYGNCALSTCWPARVLRPAPIPASRNPILSPSLVSLSACPGPQSSRVRPPVSGCITRRGLGSGECC